MIARIPVKSSAIAAIGFDEGVLVVEFTRNPKRPHEVPRVYAFEPCTLAEYVAIIESDSIGKALFEFRRSPGLRTTRLDDADAWPKENPFHDGIVPEYERALSADEMTFNGLT